MPQSFVSQEPHRGQGTRIRFLADPEIFEDVDWNFDTLAQRLRELSFLNAGVQITLRGRENEQEE